MGNKTATRRPLRRLATFTAAVGMLVMSSGVALMVTAAPANAANKVGICHATSSDTNPYVFISVDDDSAKLKGHLQHLTDPNKTWKSDGTFNGVPHEDGDAKRDLIGSFTDDQGIFHLYDGEITADDCNGEVELEATADVEFTDPTCLNENEASYEGVGENVSFEITDGAAAPGSFIEVTATADEGSTFEGGGSTEVFTHTFDPAVNLEGAPCVIVNPPAEVTPVAPEFVDPTCATEPSVVLPEPSEVIEEEVPSKVGAVVDSADVDGVHYEVSGDVVPGGTVEVTASAIPPSVLAEGAVTFWTHTFAELTDCGAVLPPTETPTVTPTVVSAGALPPVVDLRAEQGLALIVGGMLLLLMAGAFGLVRPGGVTRS